MNRDDDLQAFISANKSNSTIEDPVEFVEYDTEYDNMGKDRRFTFLPSKDRRRSNPGNVADIEAVVATKAIRKSIEKNVTFGDVIDTPSPAPKQASSLQLSTTETDPNLRGSAELKSTLPPTIKVEPKIDNSSASSSTPPPPPPPTAATLNVATRKSSAIETVIGASISGTTSTSGATSTSTSTNGTTEKAPAVNMGVTLDQLQNMKLRKSSGSSNLPKPTLPKKSESFSIPIARALFSYKNETNDIMYISFVKDDIIYVIKRRTNFEGWCLGEIGDKTGLFPETYVEFTEQTTQSLKKNAFFDDKAKICKVIYNFSGSTKEEMSVKESELLIVESTGEDRADWIYVSRRESDEKGWVPVRYVQVL